MKYFVLIPDGMADEKIEALGGRTPMQAAKKPMMDELAKKSLVGTVSTVPEGMVFAMGDNRNNSKDSRDSGIGFIDERYVVGKVCMRLLPVSDFTIFD